MGKLMNNMTSGCIPVHLNWKSPRKKKTNGATKRFTKTKNIVPVWRKIKGGWAKQGGGGGS